MNRWQQMCSKQMNPVFYDLLVRNKVNVLLYSIFFVMISVISISWMKQNTENCSTKSIQ